MKTEDSESKNQKGDPAPARLRVLVVRHAIAEDRQSFARTGEPDGLRPLTRPGRRKMRRVAEGLKRIVPRLHALGTSPLTRAVQTAEIVSERYGKLKTHRVAALAPGKSMNALLAWLGEQPAGRTVALVGHEPHLGQFISWTLSGLRESFIPLKKGGACLLEFTDEVKAAHAKIVWVMRPAQLRTFSQ